MPVRKRASLWAYRAPAPPKETECAHRARHCQAFAARSSGGPAFLDRRPGSGYNQNRRALPCVEMPAQSRDGPDRWSVKISDRANGRAHWGVARVRCVGSLKKAPAALRPTVLIFLDSFYTSLEMTSAIKFLSKKM